MESILGGELAPSGYERAQLDVKRRGDLGYQEMKVPPAISCGGGLVDTESVYIPYKLLLGICLHATFVPSTCDFSDCSVIIFLD